MSLNIYTKRSYFPKEKKYYKDPEALFMTVELKNNEVIRDIIKTIDQGEYCGGNYFTDRFGISLYTSFLSTGSKILICLYSMPEIIVDGRELGTNALEYMFRLDRGNIYIPVLDRDFTSEAEAIDVCVNHTKCTTIDEVNGGGWMYESPDIS